MGSVVSTILGAVSTRKRKASGDERSDDSEPHAPQSCPEASERPSPAITGQSSPGDSQSPPSQAEKPSPALTAIASKPAAQQPQNQKRPNEQTPPFKKQKTDFNRQQKAEERNRKRKKKRGIPVRGKKDFDVDDSLTQKQSLDEARSDWLNSLRRQRHVSTRALSKGVWRAAQQHTEILEVRAKWTRTMGHSDGGKLYLNVEETVFLVEHAQLEVSTDKGVVFSLQDAYQLLEQCDFPLDKYLVYAHLRRANYVVQRSQAETTGNAHAAAEDSAKSAAAATQNPDEIAVPSDDADGENNNGVEDGEDDADDGDDDADEEDENDEEEDAEADRVPLAAPLPAPAQHQPQQHQRLLSVSADDMKPLVNDIRTITEYELNKLSQVVPRTSFKHRYYHPAPHAPALTLQVDFDVWAPERIYKKKNPGRPNFRLTVCNFYDPPPSLLSLERLTRLSGSVQLKVCVICQGAINFYSFSSKPPEAGDTASLFLEQQAQK